MSLDRNDYLAIGKTMLNNVVANPSVILNEIPAAHQAQAVGILSMVLGLFHMFSGYSAVTQPTVSTPSVSAPTVSDTEVTSITGYPSN